jgi:ATP-dependent Clp protease ATP-binding subunit ClpA
MNLIVNAEVEKTEAMLAPKNISLNVTQHARDWLAKNGLDPVMGARPFERLFEAKVKMPLSTEILFSRLRNGGRAHIDVDNEELTVTILDAIVETVRI